MIPALESKHRMVAVHSSKENRTPPLLATKTKSAGVSTSAANLRQLSLRSLLILLRTMAEPSLRPTQNPTRIGPDSRSSQ